MKASPVTPNPMVLTHRAAPPARVSLISMFAAVLSLGSAVALYGQSVPSTPANPLAAPASAAKPDESDGVQKLPEFFVSTSAAHTFAGNGGNMDIPRTSNDVQPYTIINAEAIAESNRLNLGDFLQDQVTQSVTGLQYTQTPAVWDPSSSATSQVNLRGFGNLQTLILVNGTRATGVVFKGVEFQPNVNNIPLAAIDHVEILPSSASGIYGSSAVGGVINIILKKNFTGGQYEVGYQNTFATDSPTRTASLYDSIFIKKTHISFILSYSDGKGPVRQDRSFIKNNFYRAVNNAPDLFYTANTPFTAGALPNIALNPGVVNGYVNPSTSALVLKNGVSLGSTVTYVPAGTSLTTDSATLGTGLLANAGKQNLDEAPSIYRGSQTPLLSVPQNRTFGVTVTHKFNDRLDAYVDLNVNQQRTINPYLPLVNGNNSNFLPFYFAVPGNSPANPFQQNVNISLPLPANDGTQFVTTIVTRTAKAGFQLHLPNGWEVLAEYSYSYATNSIKYGLMNFASTNQYGAEATLVYKGLYNPFVDSLKYDQGIAKYYGVWTFFNPTHLMDFNARASGPVINVPAGKLRLTTGIEARLNVQDTNYEVGTFPSLPGDNGAANISDTPTNQFFNAEKQLVKAVFAEATIPVVSEKNNIPFVRNLELQVAGRQEYFTVITNPDQITIYPNYADPATRVTHTANPGRYWFKYSSANPTLGVKYTPVNWLITRGSYASGFVPPTYNQFGGSLSGSSVQNTAATFDPKTGLTYAVPVLLGTLANPDLKPQTSKNWDMGFIIQPQSGLFKDLRLSFDFYRTKEFNTISRPSYAQALASPELAYLVPRGANGLVTSFSSQFVNTKEQFTTGYDVSVDYKLNAAKLGRFNLHAAGTFISQFKKPFAFNGPLVEYADFPNSGGVIKTKANASLTWLAGKNWTLGWNTRYWGSYKQQGSPGDPQYNGVTPVTLVTTQLRAQGGAAAINGISIPSQMYHNVFATYTFGSSLKEHRFFEGTTIQIGVNDLFNTAPPFDANNSYVPFYYSPYGNVLLRTYLLKIKKDF